MGRVVLAGATVWAGPACVPSRAWMLVEDGRVAALGRQEPLPLADRVVGLEQMLCERFGLDHTTLQVDHAPDGLQAMAGGRS